MRGWRRLTAVLVAAVIAASAAAPARAADHGIELLSSQALDGRLTELTLSTQALPSLLADPERPVGELETGWLASYAPRAPRGEEAG